MFLFSEEESNPLPSESRAFGPACFLTNIIKSSKNIYKCSEALLCIHRGCSNNSSRPVIHEWFVLLD